MKLVIFVVDDEPDALDLYARTLRGRHEVKTFTDPTEALSAAQAEPPALVIADHRTPGLTGVQLVRKLQEAKVECATLMVTGFPELVDVVEAQKNKVFFQVIPKTLET